MKYLLVVSCLFLHLQCSKNIATNERVESYMQSLVNGTYNQHNLPDFNEGDIPALLTYRSDRTIIADFPRNPISSFYQEEARLGVLALWSIEAIRLHSIGIDWQWLGFPSLNPRLTVDSSMEQEAQEEAAEAYFQWWNRHSNQPLSEFDHIDPLDSLPYQWL